MPIEYHPRQGAIVRVAFDGAFREPEMVKPRLCVVLSKPMKSRPNLCTVVPLSTTPPLVPQAYQCELNIPFELPKPWGNIARWVKGDMVYAVGFHRVELLRLGKGLGGKRIYQTSTISSDDLRRVQTCVLNGLGLSDLTNHL